MEAVANAAQASESVGDHRLEDRDDRLGMAAFLALHPEFLAGAAPKVGFARFQGLFERGPVHPGHHYHAPGFLFLNNGGNQSAGIKLQFFVKTHDPVISPQNCRDKKGNFNCFLGRRAF